MKTKIFPAILPIKIFFIFLLTFHNTYSQTLDDSFQPPPVLRSANVSEILELPDRSLLLQGDLKFYQSTPIAFNVVKLNQDGSLNSDFHPEETIRFFKAYPGGQIIGYNGRQIVRMNRKGEVVARSEDIMRFSNLLILPDERIIVTTYSGGLLCYDRTLNPDRRFNSNASFFNGQVSDMKVQGKKIIVGGGFNMAGGVYRQSVARINPNGTVDESFDAHFGPGSYVASIFIQSDDKILFPNSNLLDSAGVPFNRIIRLNDDGVVDETFNPPSTLQAENIFEHDNQLWISAFNTVQRINPDGSMDETFPTITYNSRGTSQMTLTDDGELILSNLVNTSSPYGIVKYDVDGLAVESFHPELTRFGLIKTMAGQGEKILIGGDFFRAGNISVNNIARLNADGTVDSSFSINGNVNPIQKIVATADAVFISYGFYLSKFLPDGTPDLTFANGSSLAPKAFEILPDGKILLADGNGIARLNSDGTVDGTFAGPSFACCSYYETDFDLQSDGKIIFKPGKYSNSGLPSLVRLNADGTIDNTFTAGNINPWDDIFDVEVLSNDDIVLTGVITGYNGTSVTDYVVKLSRDGVMDGDFQDNFDFNNQIYISLRARGFRNAIAMVLYGNTGNSLGAVQFYGGDGQTLTGSFLPLSVLSVYGEYSDIYAPDENTLYIMGEIYANGYATPLQLIRVTYPAQLQTTPVVREYAIYPNPSSDFITVTADEGTSISVTGADGLLRQTRAVMSNQQEIDVRDLPAGRYLISFVRDGQMVVKQLLKQ